ncbi:hypothetical protein HDE68_004165 [Pedobacter cryoconitis]|uniref:Uncharacterized protein n=1 Tax=Pedobacter cryoconitis TaxID=188932 RepID=A0A7W8ZQB2_9SPHI|nr:hypothetical protein [Pedobacter cryoconitis]MBB5638239.1 hypothetical protein [Pedobacter cryoconitis]
MFSIPYRLDGCISNRYTKFGESFQFPKHAPNRSPTGWETVHVLGTSKMQKACYHMIFRALDYLLDLLKIIPEWISSLRSLIPFGGGFNQKCCRCAPGNFLFLIKPCANEALNLL